MNIFFFLEGAESYAIEIKIVTVLCNSYDRDIYILPKEQVLHFVCEMEGGKRIDSTFLGKMFGLTLEEKNRSQFSRMRRKWHSIKDSSYS